MTKQSHTPGPWTVTKLDGIHPNVVAGTRHIAGVYDLCIDSQRPEDVANARLIATAPRVLAALKAILANEVPSDAEWKEAEAAVREAEGV
jgi:hypothetical protein